NRGTRMDPTLVDFVFAERFGPHPGQEQVQERLHPAGEVTLDYVRDGESWAEVVGQFKMRNRTTQTLHVVFAYFSNAYEIQVFSNEPVPPGDDYVTLAIPNVSAPAFSVEPSLNQATERFRLVVSTERVDDFLLTQGPLTLGATASSTRGFGQSKAIAKYEKEWFTRSLNVTIVRQQNRVSLQDATVATHIVVKRHPSFTASLALAPAASPSRGVGDASDFYKALERHRVSDRRVLELYNFGNIRGGNDSVLELTDMQNTAALQSQPLEIEVRVPLAEDEALLPMVFDGEHVMLGGDTYKDEHGHTHISIDRIPETHDNRRSLGGSLKLYFFKTYLKISTVNRLRWVSFTADGGCEYHDGGLAAKVAAAQHVLLLVHGIIGDTEGMARGVKDSGLDRRFDLVLTYDYENLSTPIEETARTLKTQLAAAGLHAQDGRTLTLLVHSMGGLVSRWFIEREGGNAVVDHLVMCGTPNNGSPFGEIDGARKILSLLTGLAVNFAPMFIPFSSALLLVLNRSKKVTPTLEQMNPASPFIAALNASDDPGIRYTILAGDVGAYKPAADGLFEKLLAKTGQGVVFDALFSLHANDIAVSVDSILGVANRRALAPVRRDVACHHLNYFVSDVGQAALTAVEW
ncbi:MAG: hypothetical protein ABI652_04660, partial [Acidobacteriota bacterium]